MAAPTGTIEVYYTGTPTDITSSTFAVTTSRGRAVELDETLTGTAVVDLRNFDGSFIPGGFGGSSSVVPGKRVKITFGTTVVFDGEADDWDHNYDSAGVAHSRIVCIDGLGPLARQEFDQWVTDDQDLPGERMTAIIARSEVDYSGTVSFDDGYDLLQSDFVSWGSNVLNYCQLVARTARSRLFVTRDGTLTLQNRPRGTGTSAVTFADDGTGIKFAEIGLLTGSDLLFNRIGVDRAGGVLQTKSNTASQTSYQVRSLTLPGVLFATDTQSAELAGFLSNLYSEPDDRVGSITVVLNDLSGANQTSLCELDLGDQVSVKWTPTGGTQVTQVSTVEGVAHTRTSDTRHTIRFALAPLQQPDPLVLGDATDGVLGGTNVWAY